MSIPQNFTSVEQRSLSVTSTSGAVQFTNKDAAAQPDILLTNYGTKGCQVAFGANTLTALNTAGAGGSQQVYVPGGAVMTIGKGAATWMAAICDGADTTNLIALIGRGQ